MTDTKFEYVEILVNKGFFLIDDPESPNLNFAIHSVLNTIALEELIDYYFSLERPKIKTRIEANIIRRLENENNLEDLYENLFKALSGAEYQTRQRIRKILLMILPNLEPIHSKEFFDTFYHSQFVHDKTAALTISGRIWDESLNELILGDYLLNGKEIYLKTYLEFGNINYCLGHLKQIWENEPNNYLKINIVRKLSRKHIDKLNFLRESEPEKYLFAVSFSEQEFDDETILNIYNDIPYYLKPYGLLSLSKLNKWDIIETEIKKYVC